MVRAALPQCRPDQFDARHHALGGGAAVHDRTAAARKLGAVHVHAGSDRREVGDVGTAEAERIAAAHQQACALNAKLGCADSTDVDTAKASTIRPEKSCG
jgi:hypothetical protein